MEDAFRRKSFLVFGANGEIGRQVCLDLMKQGAAVIAFAKNSEAKQEYIKWMGEQLIGVPVYAFTGLSREFACVVTSSFDVSQALNKLLVDIERSPSPLRFDGLVYAVGHCPSEGLEQAIGTVFHNVQAEDMVYEFQLHVAGLHRVFSEFWPALTCNGKVAVLGANIVSTVPEQWPEFLHIESYFLAKSAQRNWCACMQHVHPEIKITYVPLPSVDTSFHHGCLHKPPHLMPIAEASALVLEALK